MHGIVSVFERLVNIHALKIPKFVKVGITFLLVTFAWSLFRSQSVSDALLLRNQLFHGGAGSIYQPITDSFQDLIEISFLYRAGLGSIISRFPYLPVVTFTAASLLACFTMRNTQEKTSDLKFTNRTLLTAAGLMFWSIISLSEISEFLYFNF